MTREELSVSKRQDIIRLHGAQGKSYTEIAMLTNINRNTVARVIQRYKYEGRVSNLPRKGRPSVCTDRMRRAIKRLVDAEPEISAQSVAIVLNERHGIAISCETVRRYIHKFGYKAYNRRKKPQISPINRKRRLEFAKKYVNHPPEFWKKVLFTDESKFNIFGWDGTIKVWRPPGEGLNPKYTAKTVKHNGGGVLVWGCMAANGVGNLQVIDGIMDQYVYINILKQNLGPSLEKLGMSQDYWFQQDNDPKHTAFNSRLFLLYNTPHQLKSPPQSPDLNPIEHAWELLERKIRQTRIKNRVDLENKLKEAWITISEDYTQNLVNSMPRRLAEVIKMKGYATRY
uniref:Transposase n=1 Tax=Anopheles albimanus TaxID=7167 RepID=Q16925_ANOAL|nr:transposase [Anopheles albimanus]